MKNITIIFVFLSLVCLQHLHAQTEQGRFLVGGSVGGSYNSFSNTSNLSFGIGPYVGFFVMDDLAIGSGLYANFNRSRNPQIADGIISYSFGISPFARFYFHDFENAKTFAELGAGYSASVARINGDPVSNTNFSANLAVGIAFFLNEHVAVETALRYNASNLFNNLIISNLSLGAGFRIYLGQSTE